MIQVRIEIVGESQRPANTVEAVGRSTDATKCFQSCEMRILLYAGI
jgi:hypothetical protein